MTEQTASASSFLLPWSEFHHIALVTRDLDATIRFYPDVLVMDVIFTAPAKSCLAETYHKLISGLNVPAVS